MSADERTPLRRETPPPEQLELRSRSTSGVYRSCESSFRKSSRTVGTQAGCSFSRCPSALTNNKIAPPIGQFRYHVYFLHDLTEQDLVADLVDKLSRLGFRCAFTGDDASTRFSPAQGALFAVTYALSTVVVASPDFVANFWSIYELIFSQSDYHCSLGNIVLLIPCQCDVPRSLSGLEAIRLDSAGWWTTLLSKLSIPSIPGFHLRRSSTAGSLCSDFQNCHLLVSIKSRGSGLGRQLVEPELPAELLQHGAQVSSSDFAEAVKVLMTSKRFTCHLLCYNCPFIITFFLFLLAFCLIFVPILEKRFSLSTAHHSTYLHAVTAWLALLTTYVALLYVARRSMKTRAQQNMARSNAVLLNSKLLCCVEHLGLAEYNKYYLHIFYYDIGPCLNHIQESLYSQHNYGEGCSTENPTSSSSSSSSSDAARPTDQIAVLLDGQISNTTIQLGAEDLLLRCSGRYLNLLIRKKLDRPLQLRHVTLKNLPRLCQFAEQSLFGM